MPWLYVMVLQNTAAAVFALQSRKLATRFKGAHYQVLSIVFGVLYATGLLFVVTTQQPIAFMPDTIYWGRMLLGGILFGSWAVLSYKVFTYVDAAIASLLSTLNIVAVVIVSTLFLHESLTVRQLFGALLLLASMLVILSRKVSKTKRTQWTNGLLLSLLASSTYGFAIANEKWLLNHIGIGTYAVYGLGLQWLALLVLSLLFGANRYFELNNKAFLKEVSIAGLSRGLAGLLFLYTMINANNASLVSVLSGFKVIIAALIAAMFLGETEFMRYKLMAAVVAFLGVAILAWK